MSKLPAVPKLVGRDREIEQLTQYLRSALKGRGAAVFISGEAGVGKTRLVNEFLTLAKKKGTGIFAGWCLSEANIPYFPFREAFNSYVTAISIGKTKSTVRGMLRDTGWFDYSEFEHEPKKHELYLTPQIERDRTFQAAARVLLQLSAQEPLILFLDDLHWADPLSLALLQYLSRKCRNSRLLIIGTYRFEELARAEGEKPHPLEETMFSMNREDLLIKMELAPLKRDDFPELLKSIFRSALNEEFEEKLFEETEGNPLFAIEMLNMLADEGYLSEKGERWTLTAPMERIGIPFKVHEVITRRIERLGREERKLLDIAAVCSHYFTPDTLSGASALDVADVLQMLVELERKHRLIHSIDSEFEFSHHKIREVIYGSLPAELRRIYHLKIAHCIEQALTKQVTDGYMADMVLHSIEGGVSEKAFEYLLRLGEKAANIYANAQAIDYLTKALNTVQENPSFATSENLARIYKHRGIAWLHQDEKAKARNDFNLMLQSATAINGESIAAEAHYYLGTAYEAYFGEMEEAMRHLTMAVELARKTGNKPLEARSLGSIGFALVWGLDTIDEGCMWLEESSRIAEEIGDRVTACNCFNTLGFYYSWKGEFDQAKENLNKALALDEEMGAIPRITNDLFCLCMVLAGDGEYNEAISAGQRSLQLARNSGDWSTVSMVLNTLAWIYHDLSNIELALRYNNEAIENARAHQKSRASGAVPMSLLNLGMDYLYKNDYENAEKYFKEVSNQYQQHRLGWWRVETRMLLGRGVIALAKNDYQQVLEFAEDSLAISEKAGAKKYIANGLKLKAEVFAKMGNIAEAVGLIENALKLAQQVGNPTQLWQLHYSFGLLEEKHGDAQKANEHYAKAIALIEAVASRLNDAVLRSTLLTSQETRAVRDAVDRLMPNLTEKAAGSGGFEPANINASVSVPKEFVPGEEFEVKLDLTNVGKRPGLLVRIDDLVPLKCKVLRMPSHCTLEGSSLNMKGRRLDPFSVESVSVWVQIPYVIGVSLSPNVVYVDELGNFRATRIEEVKILPVVEFESKVAQVVFNFLVDAFVEDCAKRRLGVEKSGWRSFPQIIRGTGVSKRSLYGAGGRMGHGLSELQRKGLVELETLIGERGRGGHVLRVRIHYEKELVKKYIKEKAPDLLT
jgi:tetratricopeptide (TPR) repeat protein